MRILVHSPVCLVPIIARLVLTSVLKCSVSLVPSVPTCSMTSVSLSVLPLIMETQTQASVYRVLKDALIALITCGAMNVRKALI